MTGIVFDDDARIVAIQVHKVYAIDDEGAWVSVRPCTSVRPELPTTPEELARVC
jgi:Holliday junction resolvase RusA-like endonuclease